MNDKKTTFEEVVRWVTENTDKTQEIDQLNKLTYPFTSTFKRRNGGQSELE